MGSTDFTLTDGKAPSNLEIAPGVLAAFFNFVVNRGSLSRHVDFSGVTSEPEGKGSGCLILE